MVVCVVYALKWLLSVLKWQKYWFNLLVFLCFLIKGKAKSDAPRVCFAVFASVLTFSKSSKVRREIKKMLFHIRKHEKNE